MGRSVQVPEIVEILKPRKFLATGFKGTKTYWEWETGPRPLSLVNAPYLTVGLVVRGYSDDDIRKIIGGNFLRVAGAIMDKQPRGRLT
jgi:membrane dipeptidase